MPSALACSLRVSAAVPAANTPREGGDALLPGHDMNERNSDGPAGQTPEGGAPLVGDYPVYFNDPVQDAMMNMILELSAQLWINIDRLHALEDLLARQGVVSAADLHSYKPDAERAVALKARRERFTHDILRDLKSLTDGAVSAPPEPETS